jgi:chromosomal replication initiation ATPase DnaA
MYRLRTETGLSFPQIGLRLGGRDHSTVIHGVKTHCKRNGLELPA